MTNVPRHDYPTRNATAVEKMLGRHYRQAFDFVAKSPDWFGSALTYAVKILGSRCSVDEKADELETWEACVTAMQVGSALFTSAQATSETFDRMVGHEQHTLHSGATTEAHAGHWLTAFWLACICREKQRMNELCQVPAALLRQAAGTFDPYIYHWVEALRAYWLGRPELGDELVTAAEGTDPDTIRYADPSSVLLIMYPPMNLLTHLIQGDQEKFNTALTQALELHKDYWTRDEERALSSESLIALAPLALACLARDAGFTIDVESPYLPKYLLEGEWVGEFPTS